MLLKSAKVVKYARSLLFEFLAMGSKTNKFTRYFTCCPGSGTSEISSSAGFPSKKRITKDADMIKTNATPAIVGLLSV